MSFEGASVNMVTMGGIGGGGAFGLGKDLLDYTMCWKIVDKLRAFRLAAGIFIGLVCGEKSLAFSHKKMHIMVMSAVNFDFD